MDDKIKGLVYGSIIGDIAGIPFKGKNAQQNHEYGEFNGGDWTGITDRTTIIIDAMLDAQKHSKEYINIFYLAERYHEWQDKGIIELPPRQTRHIGMNLNFVLKQKDYLTNPINSSCRSYKLTGGDSATNDALVCNAICGIKKKWYKNTILHTIITTYDSRCLSACVVQSNIIYSIFWRKPINWTSLNALCQKLIVNQKFRKTNNLIEYNNHWHIALNYSNFIRICKEDDPFESFLEKLNIGDYNANDAQSYSLLGMVLSMVIVIDIQGEISAGRCPDEEYYIRRVSQLAARGGDATSNCAIVGAIIGAFIGFKKLPQEWIKKINNTAWLDLKLQKLKI